MNYLEEARREVDEKTRGQIEEETAYRWAARAVAAYEHHEQTGGEMWLRDAIDYMHEATEHAAFADTTGRVLRDVRQWVHRYVPRGIL